MIRWSPRRFCFPRQYPPRRSAPALPPGEEPTRTLPTLLAAAAALALIAGHVAAAHDPKLCAGDIAAAFLADPTKQLDVTCAQSDEYKLKFVLK